MQLSSSRSLNRLSFILILLFITVGWVLTVLLPISWETRFALLGLAVFGGLYNTFIATQYFDRARIWRILIPIINTIIITIACLLLLDVMPMVSAFYILSIAAVAIRGRTGAAVWTAFLSTLGQLVVELNSGKFFNLFDLGILGGVFFFVALLTGRLADAAHEYTRELARRHRELDAERLVAHAASQSLELNRVLNLTLDQSLATLNVESGAIFLADEKQTTLTLAIARGFKPEVLALVKPYAFGEGITGAAALERQVLAVTNASHDTRIRPELRDYLVSSQISVPLITQARVVGVLNLGTFQPREFSAEDIALLRALGASVAVAIDHARLFATLERRVSERTQELDALNRITQQVTQSLDLDAILATAMDELMRTLNVAGCWVRLYDAAQGHLVLRAQLGASTQAPADERVLRVGEGVSGYVVELGHPVALNVAESNLTNRHSLLAQGCASVAAAPLFATGELVGVLGLASETRDRFGEAELRWLTSAGNALAIAIKNAQLYAAAEKRVRQLATLREIDHVLNTMLELDPMLQVMLEQLEAIVPYTNAAVLLVDDYRAHTVAARGAMQEALLAFSFDVRANAVFQETVRLHAPLLFDDLANEPRWQNLAGMDLKQAWLGVPLIARDEVIGQIALYGGVPHAFTREHGDLVMAFADHAAVTIANMRLRAELREQARRDSLTGALNHGAFIEEVRLAATQTDALALIMLDLDNYKRYNDQYGHVVGDRVLTTVVQTICQHIKRRDFVGRWGGEEFGIVLVGADYAQTTQVAGRIRATLAETLIMDRDGAPIPPPTVSQGIAAIPASAQSVDELIDRADRALYRAKARGRDQIITWANGDASEKK